jgi:hypothetical protein
MPHHTPSASRIGTLQILDDQGAVIDDLQRAKLIADLTEANEAAVDMLACYAGIQGRGVGAFGGLMETSRNLESLQQGVKRFNNLNRQLADEVSTSVP